MPLRWEGLALTHVVPLDAGPASFSPQRQNLDATKLPTGAASQVPQRFSMEALPAGHFGIEALADRTVHG